MTQSDCQTGRGFERGCWIAQPGTHTRTRASRTRPENRNRPTNEMVAMLSTSAFVGQRVVAAKTAAKPRKVACKVVSAHAEPRQIALAGVAAAAVVLDATASLAAPSASMDASALYKKVEPERTAKSRFDGTEVAKLKANGGKTAPAPKAAASASKPATASKPAPASKSAPAKKKSSKKTDSQASSGGALAAVVALGGLFAANATRGGDSSSSSSSGSSGSSSGGKSDAAANAAEAQKWIDSWKGSSPAPAAGAGADTPEGRAAEAQAWIDAWKAKQ
ncbi:predicted protein [Micromonas commoda]|uniref:Uncharacterized protein n=1 Tax=Micromonas commoda (strain RCC299 / NOUM17 / CCMP2709) TaxID=296587 RepID=C1E4P5_MICCC|nr:predicted protein [Micromonas commoda]ACO62755.1 predicted protein [Micromonas commoda]|eukprot:XP_002501497.1 predicted protein [Micromonas commoda]